jgi:hypothetical protein
MNTKRALRSTHHRKLQRQYGDNADSYFESFRERLQEVLLSPPETSAGRKLRDRSIDAIDLIENYKRVVRRFLNIPAERNPYDTPSLKRDKKLLRRLKKLYADTVLNDDVYGGITLDLVLALEKEIPWLEGEIERNSRDYGTARDRKSSTYTMAGGWLYEALLLLEFPYAAAESAVFIWYCGAKDRTDMEVLDPFGAAQPAPAKDFRDALQENAKKRFAMKKPR